jgi:hypothetical protein
MRRMTARWSLSGREATSWNFFQRRRISGSSARSSVLADLSPQGEEGHVFVSRMIQESCLIEPSLTGGGSTTLMTGRAGR